MSDLKLIVAIVPHGSGELITKTAAANGAGGGTIAMARGTAESKIAQVLGFGDTSKDIAYVIVDVAQNTSVIDSIKQATSKKKSHFGVLFTIDVSYFSHAENFFGGINTMAHETSHQVITVIANKGYSDDIMAAARNAGAGGGTILTARGTANPNDKKFLGMEIVPEKEVLYIITETSSAQKIIDEIKSLKCLSKRGSGIVFALPAENFTTLGQTK